MLFRPLLLPYVPAALALVAPVTVPRFATSTTSPVSDGCVTRLAGVGGGSRPPGGGGGGGGGGDGDDDSREGCAIAAVLIAGRRLVDDLPEEELLRQRQEGQRQRRRRQLRRQNFSTGSSLALAWPPQLRWLRFPWQQRRSPAPAAPEAEEEQLLPTFQVEDVAVLDTSLVPREVLSTAAVASGLLGSHCGGDELRTCAEYINGWYAANGYKLSKVVNADIFPETGSVVFKVDEPRVSSLQPVRLTYLQRVNASDPESLLKPRPKKGKTNPGTVAHGLGLKPGDHFRIDDERWQAVVGSGLFDGANMVGATRDGQGGVTLDMAVLERKSVVFEPGVTKTLFDSNWAGEVVFEERNLLGRNCVLGLDVRRSMRSPLTSCSVRLSNNRFSRPGAWNVVVFRDLVVGGGGGRDYGAMGPGSGSSSGGGGGLFGGVSRDLKMLAKTIAAAQRGQASATAEEAAVAPPKEGEQADPAAPAAAAAPAVPPAPGASKRQGVAARAQWRYRALAGSVGAQVQQVAPLNALGREDVVSLSGRVEHRCLLRPRPMLRLPRLLPRLRARWGRGGAAPASAKAASDEEDFVREGNAAEAGARAPAAALMSAAAPGGQEAGRRGPQGPGPQRRPQPSGIGRGGGNGGGQQPLAQLFMSFDAKNGVVLNEQRGSADPFFQVSSTSIQKIPLGLGGALVALRQRGILSTARTPRHEISAIGGQHTVRGYVEGGLGLAKTALLGSAELRIPVPPLFGKGSTNTEAVLFVDAAAFTNFRRPRLARSHAARWGLSGGGGEGKAPGAAADDDMLPPAAIDDAGLGWTNAGGAVAAAIPGGDAGSAWHKPASPGGGGGSRGNIRMSSGVGLRIAGLIKVDLSMTADGIQQVHLGLVDAHY